MLSKSELVVINDIIDNIYMQPDFDKMRREFLEMIKTIIPFNQATFFLASETEKHILGSPVAIGVSSYNLQKYIDEYEAEDYTRWIFMSRKSVVFRESDLFTDDMRKNEPFYADIYEPSDMYFAAHISCTNKGEFIGLICFYRGQHQSDFNEKEMFIMQLLQSHIENRIAIELRKNNNAEFVKSRTYFDAYKFIEEYQLTNREVEILGLLMGGLKLDKICEMLSISSSTLKKHSINIYRKLDISHRWELIKFK